MSDKTEEPTPKRLRKAREEGDSGVSTQAAQAIAFLVAVSLAPAAVSALASRSSDLLKSAIARAGDATPGAVDPTGFAMPVVLLIVPVLLAAGFASAVVQFVQTGGFIASKKLTPKLDRLNLFEGIKGLFSSVRAIAVVRAVLAGSIVAWLAFRGLRAHAADVAHVAGQLGFVGMLAGEIARQACRDAALFGIAVGAVDLFVTRRAWMKRLRMSKDEVKREYKESEGDPQMKAARERAHHEMLASATVANVKNATVIVVNPTHIACALRYDEEEGDDAPLVLAVGEGDLAKRIIEAARAYGVPVLRDVPLARALVELEPGERIPEELYEAVAEILREAWGER
ncbi:MAG TPA: EscU/YscU/HrcU family type III secretion system export apparatus switch protein [Polyangiaceae bacterium]|jgi:flagellar biosynthesis protein FlhB